MDNKMAVLNEMELDNVAGGVSVAGLTAVFTLPTYGFIKVLDYIAAHKKERDKNRKTPSNRPLPINF